MSPRVKEIIRMVCKRHGITREQLFGRSQRHEYAYARFEAWSRIRALRNLHGEPAFSFPQIGRFFGRDHTTIWNGVQRWAAMGYATPESFDICPEQLGFLRQAKVDRLAGLQEAAAVVQREIDMIDSMLASNHQEAA